MLQEPEIISFPGNGILQEFLSELSEFKDYFFKGFYLTGSIPLRDFQPGKSDIDFIILCDKLPGKEIQSNLKQVHSRIEKNFKDTTLSGFYITENALNIDLSGSANTLRYHEGKLCESFFEMAPITLYELKTTALTLFGVPSDYLPIKVDIHDVNKFLYENINSYWTRWVTDHSSVFRKHILLILIPRLTEWVILGLSRQLYTLKTGKITSKTKAGHYCLQYLPQKYHSIIHDAINIRHNTSAHLINLKPSYYVIPSMKRARETIACSNYIIQLFNKENKNFL